jgi:hypothetical protein
MNNLTEQEKTELFELTQKHIELEKRLADRLKNPKVEPISRNAQIEWFTKILEIEEEIRERLAELPLPPIINDPSLRDQLAKIRDKKSHSRKQYIELEWEELKEPLRKLAMKFETLSSGKKEKLIEELSNLVDESKKSRDDKALKEKEDSYLDGMIHYLMEFTGYSGNFHDKKKDFGTIIVSKPIPEHIHIFLDQIRLLFLLNQFEGVIALSRTILEIACEDIFSRDMPEQYKKIHHLDGEIGARKKIREACKFRLKSLGKPWEDRDNTKKLAEAKYGEASDILHGELQAPKTEGETLKFVKEVFSIIEALY